MPHISEFKDAITAAGLNAPMDVIDDGKLHRFSSNGKPRNQDGWYVLHNDDRPAGKFGCWSAGVEVTWQAKTNRTFTPEEKAQWERDRQARDAEREKQRQRLADYAARTASNILRTTHTDYASSHPYLVRKGVEPFGVTVGPWQVVNRDGEIIEQIDDALFIPVRRSARELVGLQVIAPDGERKFIYGTPIMGSYHVIGDARGAHVVVICEGYATGASIHMATGHCVVVAFTAGNLAEVSAKISRAMPDAQIVIAADNDDRLLDRLKRRLEQNRLSPDLADAPFPIKGDWGYARYKKDEFGHDFIEARINTATYLIRNTGIYEASKAASAIGAKVCIPPISGDFNDLAQGDGISDVLDAFSLDTEQQAIEVVKPASIELDYSDVGLGEDIFIFAATPLDTAQAFQDSLPDDGKILYWRDEFYVWNGCRYSVVEHIYLHKLLYRFMSNCLTKKTNPRSGDQEVVAFSPKRSVVEDVVHALRAVCFISVSGSPSWLERRAGDPIETDIIAFKNGFLNLKTRELMPSTPRLFVVNSLDFDYNPNAPEPTEWLNFLRGVWGSDQQSIDALADMFGYLLTDDTSQQKMFGMIGPPRSGKGTILRVLSELVGGNNIVSPSLASIGDRFGLEQLIGKRLAILSDARLSGRADQQPIVENILRVTGEDSVTVDRKNKSFWSGKLSSRFVLAANETPAFTDASGALANRFVMFKFTQSFLGKEDLGLTSRLLTELPSILLWALQGLDNLRARRFLLVPESGRSLSDEMREQASPIASFVSEMCIVEEGAQTEALELYRAYKEWCTQQGMDHPGTSQSFGRRLTSAIPSVDRSRPTVGGVRVRTYTGIRLSPYVDAPL